MTEFSSGTVELSATAGDHSYWEEIKVNGCKYFRNAVTSRYLSKFTTFTCTVQVADVVFIET